MRTPALLAWLLLTGSLPLAAQDEATIAMLGRVLAAEDQRNAADPVLAQALNEPDPVVRRTAALAIGRLGDLELGGGLLPLLEDPDTAVQTASVFALGLLRDSSLSAAVAERLAEGRPVATETAREGVLALARLGGQPAVEVIGAILRGTARIVVPDTLAVLREAALQAWRLGPRAPQASLLPLLDHPDRLVLEGAVYSAGRLRLVEALPRMFDLLRHSEPSVRELAARGIAPALVDSAGVTRATAVSLLQRGLEDQHPGVRTNTLRSLAALAEPGVASRVEPLLRDRDPNVRVQAAATLGALGVAGSAVVEMARGGERWAERREALLALARADTAAFREVAAGWSRSAAWRDRMVAVQGWAAAAPDDREGLALLADPDPRVVATALRAFTPAEGSAPAPVLAAARQRLYAEDYVVRAAAAAAVASAVTADDMPALVAVLRAAERDSGPDAARAALAALRRLDRQGRADALGAVVGAVPRPESSLWRDWAFREWPALSQAWGSAWPVHTGRSAEDYRDLARRFVADRTERAYPRVSIETVERGTLELELFGPDAPLTVANFLRLVDRRAYDGGSWHRVVPNFVVQDGDSRGDGSGGPGWAIRDEINPRRYDARGVVGMALDGPDTGGSQWFITLSPQPHLDGGYTIFGRVVGNQSALARLTQGDAIRTIRR